MIFIYDQRPEDQDMLRFRRRALRDAVLCIGFLKITSIICDIVLYFLVHSCSEGQTSMIIQIMLIVSIPLQILLGVLLFYGAIKERLLALEMALWLCVILAAYNTALGLMGTIFFIQTGHLTMHFLLAVTFILMAISFFTVLCHDVFIIYSLKKLLEQTPPLNPPLNPPSNPPSNPPFNLPSNPLSNPPSNPPSNTPSNPPSNLPPEVVVK